MRHFPLSQQDLAEVVERLPEALREHFEYRAAILEFDAGLPREIAERQAMEEVRKLTEFANGGS